MVSIHHKSTPRVDAPMLSCRKRLSHSLAAPAAILRRECCRDSHYFPTGSFSLVGKDACESSPCCITDTFCQFAISEHPFDVEVFYRYLVIFFQQLITQLMKEIPALVCYAQMLASKYTRCFSSIAAAQFLFTELALGELKIALALTQEARVVYRLPVAESSEVLKPYIYADAVTCLWQRLALLIGNGEDDKPAVSLSLDRAGLDLPFYLSAQTKPTRADFAQMQLVAFKPESRLRIGEGVVAVLALETREASGLTLLFWQFLVLSYAMKESVKGFAQPAENILRNLGIQAGKVISDEFDIGKLSALVVVVQRFLLGEVRVAALLKGSIVKFAAEVKGSLKLVEDFLRGFQFELIGFHRAYHSINSFI
jgi:hypothetical protein